MSYDFAKIESKWQSYWDSNKVFDVNPFELGKNKFYILIMFPYPSGDKLHMGHWYQYAPMDSWARFQRLRGKEVFFPFGFDAFGLPAENYAIKKGIHPDKTTTENVEYMKQQLKKMGVTYNWRSMLDTSKPDYYKWTQWVFRELYKKGLAYKSEAPVNWCPSCQTVLANEQVQDGQCERCDSVVVKKNLAQWFFKITAYADRLLNNIDSLDWPQRTKLMQKNWIGKSEGAEINFKFANSNKTFTVYTTRPDTLFGVTYVTLAPEHPLVLEITTKEQKEAVEKYIESTAKVTEVDRLSTAREKSGVFTGAYAVNPINNEQVPIWIADYVLGSYGSGAVMAVPAHDERDFAFAKKYHLPIKKVIVQDSKNSGEELSEAFTEVGTIINSGKYNGMMSDKMIPEITRDLEAQNLGKFKVNFRLRDWLVSRQRYWGAPIPIVYCDKCGEVLVPEEQLPVRLPSNVDFKPTGESPLKRCDDFMHTTCPQCGGKATREADTLDTFVCSSWYFLRFPSVTFADKPFDIELTDKLLPVDQYVGGPEHACMHLLYARFVTMVLKDAGHLKFEEPFKKLNHQGMILGPDGQKMSKSKGNSVSPDPYVEKYGSDILRLYLCFGFNYEEGGPWDDAGIKSVVRFVERVWRLLEENLEVLKSKQEKNTNYGPEEKKLLYVLHNGIRMITQDTERLQFNTSIARCMEIYNAVTDYCRVVDGAAQNKDLISEVLRDFILLLSPFIPHLTEEWWSWTGNTTSIAFCAWPEYKEEFLTLDEIPMAVMINGKLRGEIKVSASLNEAQIVEIAKNQPAVNKHLQGLTIAKHIFVQKKLINFIAK